MVIGNVLFSTINYDTIGYLYNLKWYSDKENRSTSEPKSERVEATNPLENSMKKLPMNDMFKCQPSGLLSYESALKNHHLYKVNITDTKTVE